jgi:hypothetical protein
MRDLLEVLRGRDFAQRVSGLPGYDTAKAGKPAALEAALNWVKSPRRGGRHSESKAARAGYRASSP